MAEGNIYWDDESKRLVGVWTLEEAATVTGGTVSIRLLDPPGTEVDSGTATAVATNDDDEDDIATAWEFYYLPPSDLDPVDHIATLRATGGGQTKVFRTVFTVWPEWSRYDRYIRRVQDTLQETEQGESLQRLSMRDYRNGVDMAVREYSRFRPRKAWQDYTLTGGDWTYTLPTGTAFTPDAPWVNGFSQVLTAPEYPRDATVQGMTYLGLNDYFVDRNSGELYLMISPDTGKVLRVPYTSPHLLSHTEDSLAAESHFPQHFESFCQYAAGWLMAGPMAAVAATTEDPTGSMGMTNYSTQFERRKSLGNEMMKMARMSWRERTWTL